MRLTFCRRAMLFAVSLIVATGAAAAQGRQDDKKDDDFNRTFSAPVETVFKLAVQTAASNWHLQSSDKDTYTLAFNTGMNMRTSVGFDMSVACVDLGGGKTRVTVHPQRRASRQLFSWKEGNRISDTFLDKLADAIKRAPAPAQDAAIPAAPLSAQPDDRAQVQIKSDPDGADILVDGKFVGNTPSELRLSAGEHSIKVQKSGFQDWERKVTVIAGGNITLNAALQRQ